MVYVRSLGMAVCLLSAVTAAQDGSVVYQRNCSVCHDQMNIERMPRKEALAQLSPEGVLAALNGGAMREQGAKLSLVERRAVAEFVTGKKFSGRSSVMPKEAFCKTAPPLTDPLSGSAWNGWGVDVNNTRHQPNPGFSASEIPKLKLKWAFAFPGAVFVNMQPVVAGGRLFIGGTTIVSLDAKSGCIAWEYKPAAPVRGAITIAKPDGVDRWLAFAGDGASNVYALDASTGELKWRTKADDQPPSRITGSPKYYANRLFVPISSLEDIPSANPKYECCRFSGAMVALNASTGAVLWKTNTIPEPARVIGESPAGHKIWGPSGASIWNSPTVDPRRNAVYAGTGNNHSNPPTATSDSIFSLDMETGKVQWTSQMTKGGDAWNIGCSSMNSNCPQNAGKDQDIGNSPILINLKNGKRALVFGQKSGEAHAVDPDDNGKLLWTARIGKGGFLGGIEWGGTYDGTNYYVPLSDVQFGMTGVDPKAGGGLFALDPATGTQVWTRSPVPCPAGRAKCSPAQSQAISSMPGAVFSGSVDGFIRAYSAKDGEVIWSFDTIQEYATVNGVNGRGGALDTAGPAIAGGILFVPSGYALWGGTPGNMLLAFSVDGK